MRCYNINCMYLIGIHAGIQSGHAQKEVSLKYLVKKAHEQGPQAVDYLTDYLENHKTVVVLNGGMYGDLLKVEKLLGKPGNTSFAWAAFRESEYALNGLLTNIAIILPEYIYAHKAIIGEHLDKVHGDDRYTIDVGDWKTLTIGQGEVVLRDPTHQTPKEIRYTEFELELIAMINPMKLMG